MTGAAKRSPAKKKLATRGQAFLKRGEGIARFGALPEAPAAPKHRSRTTSRGVRAGKRGKREQKFCSFSPTHSLRISTNLPSMEVAKIRKLARTIIMAPGHYRSS